MIKEKLIMAGLSNREIEVAQIVARGHSNKEVATKLYVTEKTIKFHLTNVYKKLKLRSRAQLIVWCAPHLDFTMPVNTEVVVPENSEPLPKGDKGL